MIKNHLIIFFPLVDWDAPTQRYQHLALLFSRNNHVIYMNSAVAITYVMRNPLNLIKKWLQFMVGKRKVNSNLSIFYPLPCLPFERMSRWVNKVNQYMLYLFIKIFVRPQESPILWINDPYKYLMIKLLKPSISIYDCPDAMVFEGNKKRKRVYDQLKKEILEQSTVCFFTSKVLLEEGRRHAKKCFYVPNGVDIGSFLRERCRTPKGIAKLQGTILGVVGTFDERIDIDLLEYVLESIQEANLVLVGPVHTRLGKLARNPRLFVAGKRQYEEIPSFIKTFHVALIPYRVNEVTKAVYPVKLHEYLVFSKPVVATGLPELKQFSDIIWIANTRDEFVQSIRLALQEKDEERRQRRIKVAKENSWDQRMSQITEILQNYL